MAEETESTPAVEKKKSPLPAIGIVLGGMLGVTMSTLFVAPRLIAGRGPAPAPAHASASEDHAESGGVGGDGHGGGAAATASGEFVELGNLLVNPAGSRGLRFLMASITLELRGPDAKSVNSLRTRDAQLRDLIISVLETYTLEDLTGPGARDSAKSQISAAVGSTFGVRVRVFMPQFVIN